jgi:hypothetical protein
MYPLYAVNIFSRTHNKYNLKCNVLILSELIFNFKCFNVFLRLLLLLLLLLLLPLASTVLIGPWPSLMDLSIHRHLVGLRGWGISPAQVLMYLVRKCEGKRPLGRPKCRWKQSIRMDFRENSVGRWGLDSLAQDRDQWRALVNTVMNLRVP